MVSEENRTGLYIALPVYFSVLVSAAFLAYKKTEVQKSDGVNDELSAHYLGGRGFGPLVTAGTLFASLFSGYTVVGVPNESYKTGWKGLRWMPSLMAIVLGYFGTGLRLHRTARVRNHQSPAEFATDRYQSNVMRYIIFFLQFFPGVIYLSAQVVAIKSTFNGIFELDKDAMYPVIVIMILILFFEWAGGLNSVAFCDTFQAFVMLTSFLAVPSVIVKNFGGWTDLDPETYPRPQFFQTMSKENQWGFWQFSLVNFSFFVLPHLMQRNYAAKDFGALRAGYTVMTIGPWFTSFVGVFMGTMGVSMLADEDGNATSPPNPFSAILEEVMSLGGFPRVAGTVAITASLAAIMSTADSLIIAISQLVTEEVVFPLNPELSKSTIHMIGKGVSLMSVCFALLVGTYWDEGISDLGAIQFALSAQAVLPYVLGLFSYGRLTECHPYSVAVSTASGAIVVFGTYFGYIKNNPDAIAFTAAFQGIITEIGVLVIAETIYRLTMADPELADQLENGEYPEILFPGRPAWDIPNTAKYGEHALTPQYMWRHMEHLNEPLSNPWFCALMFLTISSATVVSPELQPPFAPEGSDTIFLYPVPTIAGLPWWVMSTIIHSAIVTFLILFAIYQMPADLGLDEDEDKPTEVKQVEDDQEEFDEPQKEEQEGEVASETNEA